MDYCIHGHERTPENTYVYGREHSCRTCNREAKRRHKSRASAILKERRREASLRRLDAFTGFQRAYLAGLIDGEGCISATMRQAYGRSGPNCSVNLTIAMSTAEPLTTIAEWLAVAPPRWQKRANPRSRDSARLGIHGVLMAAVLRACRPYLILKAVQADIAIAMQALKEARGGRRGPGVSLPDGLLIDLAKHTTRLHVLNRRGAEAMEVAS